MMDNGLYPNELLEPSEVNCCLLHYLELVINSGCFYDYKQGEELVFFFTGMINFTSLILIFVECGLVVRKDELLLLKLIRRKPE